MVETILSPLQSTDLAAVGYNGDLEVLDVKFVKSGKTHRFYNVGQIIYAGLIAAPSAGAFFNKYIRGKYRSHPLN